MKFLEYFAKVQDSIPFSSESILLILLSILFPLVLALREELNREIDNRILLIVGYINREMLNDRLYYFTFLKSLRSGREEQVKFFTETLKVTDTNLLLLPNRSGEENEHIRGCQKEIKEKFRRVKFVNFLQYLIPVIVITILLIS